MADDTRARRFVLARHEDPTGVSGTGIVADGVVWPDQTATIHWRGEHASYVHWPRGIASVEAIHGHGGATTIRWIDAVSNPPPAAKYADSWTELVGYVDQAREDGTTIDPGDLLGYMTELHRRALSPIRAWMDAIKNAPAEPATEEADRHA
jgi:hypothetical protein